MDISPHIHCDYPVYRVADELQVPRHIQKQREEAAAGGSPQTPNGISSYYERPVMAEMDEDVWSQSEATPVVQHFPASKGGLPAGDWQALNPSTTFDPPVNHMMIDPLLLGSNAAYPTMHAEMPREELMYAMNGTYDGRARSTSHNSQSVYMSRLSRMLLGMLLAYCDTCWIGRVADSHRHASHPRLQRNTGFDSP
jgi:hypothetical protein